MDKAPREWGVDVSAGGVFFTVGVGGLLTLVVSGTPVTKCWYDVLITLLVVVLTLLGGYMLLALYFELPLPETRASREARGVLEIHGPFFALSGTMDGTPFRVVKVIFRVGLLDVANATINVRVPDFVTISRSDPAGGLRQIEDSGTTRHFAESLYPDGRHGMNAWILGPPLQLYAGTERVYHFRLDIRPPSSEPFPFQVRVVSAALRKRVVKEWEVSPPG